MTTNRKLKNLYSMFRYVGWQIFEINKDYNIARDTRNIIKFNDLNKKLTTLVQKYDMLKQILIER